MNALFQPLWQVGHQELFLFCSCLLTVQPPSHFLHHFTIANLFFSVSTLPPTPPPFFQKLFPGLKTLRNTWICAFPHLPQKNTRRVSGQEDVARVWQQPETDYDKRLNPNPADRYHANHLSLLCNGAKMMDDRVPPPLNQRVEEVQRQCTHTKVSHPRSLIQN